VVKLLLPPEIRSLRIVTAEQAAYAMCCSYAGRIVPPIYDFSNYKESILQAVRFRELKPLTATEKTFIRGRPLPLIEPTFVEAIDQDTLIYDATFSAPVIWSWVEKQLAGDYGWKQDLPQNEVNDAASFPDQWQENFAGKTTALMLIAGLAKVLEGKQGGVYLWGDQVNQTKLAEDAAQAISAASGDPTNRSKTESFRKLIAEALAAASALKKTK